MEEKSQNINTSDQIEPKVSIDNTSLSPIPGKYRVMRRNGKVTSFDLDKIIVAMTKAFLSVEGSSAAASTRIHNEVASLARLVDTAIKRRFPDGGVIHIEDIQDQVELAIMRAGYQDVARAYVIYREERSQARTQNISEKEEDLPPVGEEDPLLPEKEDLLLPEVEDIPLLEEDFLLREVCHMSSFQLFPPNL